MTNTQKNTTTESQSILARYHRAEALEHEPHNQSMVFNAKIYPHWIGDSNCFWYIRENRQQGVIKTGAAKEFRLVNAETSINVEAFDHQSVANALADASGQDVNPTNLPISELTLELSPVRATFVAFAKRWQFDASAEICKEITVNNDPNPTGGLVSPDGKKSAFSRDYNLWVRDLETGKEYALTNDGQVYYAYATQPESRDLLEGLSDVVSWVPATIEASWSPDSSKLFTMQTDERLVRSVPSMMYVPRDGTVAPRVIERKYALPGDKDIVQYRLLVIDVETAQEISADYPPINDSFVSYSPFNGNVSFASKLAWWSGDGSRTYFVDMARGQKTAKLVAFEVQTGLTEVLFEETTDTYLDLIPYLGQPPMLVPLPDTNELIWYSERTGWAHLYLYDLTTGRLKNAITSGEWRVHDILHIDELTRTLFIQIAGRVEGRNPYYREVVRVNIDSSEMTTIISGNYDCCTYRPPMRDSGVSPSGEYIVTTRSRVDDPPITELYDRHAKLLLNIESTDISGLPIDWNWPEPFTVKAADAETNIYGVIFRPTDFDPEKNYPVLDVGMGSPCYAQTPRGAFLAGGGDPIANSYYMTFAALAELGFIVIVLDGRGTPCRSKEFHDFGYKAFMQGCDIDDHVAGIKQLAQRYPYMDLERVGNITTDAVGNGPVFGLLNYSEFYKVGVAFSIWDPRLHKQGEVYYGLISESESRLSLWQDAAHKFQGKLLLITGLLDQVFHSSMSFQLVDALLSANKDIELVIHPTGGHGYEVKNAHRRAWDYLVRHLQGIEPPKNFLLKTGFEKMYQPDIEEKDE